MKKDNKKDSRDTSSKAEERKTGYGDKKLEGPNRPAE